jgi:hypothetical protein
MKATEILRGHRELSEKTLDLWQYAMHLKHLLKQTQGSAPTFEEWKEERDESLRQTRDLLRPPGASLR